MRRSRRPRLRLAVLPLEDRVTPVLNVFSGAGDWANGSLWSEGFPPNSTHDVEISAGSAATITSGLYPIQDLLVAGSLVLAGGDLEVRDAGTVNGPLDIRSGSTFTATGTLNFNATAVLLTGGNDTQQLVIKGGATLNATATTFSGGSGTNLIVVQGGGHFASAGGTFQGLAGVTLPGGGLGPGALTDNQFLSPLTLPASEVPHLGSGTENVQFTTVNILNGTLGAGQALELKQIGQSTAGLNYAFPNGFNVGPFATMTVEPGVRVGLGGDQTLAVNGTLTFLPGSDFAFGYAYQGVGRIAVGSGGLFDATDARFRIPDLRNGNTGMVGVAAGGQFEATGTVFDIGWVDLAGNTIGAGDVTDTAFNCALYLPYTLVQYLGGNRSFRAVNILNGVLAPGTVPDNTLRLDVIGPSDPSQLKYVFPNGFTVSAGTTVAVAAGVRVELGGHQTLAVNGRLTFEPGAKFDFGYVYQGIGRIAVGSGGLFRATGTEFHVPDLRNGNTGMVGVAAGGEFEATGSVFDIGWVDLAGGTFGPGDVTDNTFNTALYLPYTLVQYLGNNRSFRDVNVLNGTLQLGVLPDNTLRLNAIGTVDTSGLRYVFPTGFTAAVGTTIAVGQNVRVELGGHQTLAVNGTLTFGAGARFAFGYVYQGVGRIAVGSGGLLDATDTDFYIPDLRNGNTGMVGVAPGGRLEAAGCDFDIGWVDLAGGTFGPGDVTDNAFNCTLYLPYTLVPFLPENRNFRAVNVLADTLPTGTTLALDPIGTAPTGQLVYVFPGGFTVSPGATVAVGPGVRTHLGGDQTFATNGALTFEPGAVFEFGYAYQGVGRITVGSGGLLRATGTQFNLPDSRNGNTGYVQVAAGGRLIAHGSTFNQTGLTLTAGSLLSAGDTTGNSFNLPVTIPAGHAALLADNLVFQDVYLLGGSLTAGQTATLAPLGTASAGTQRYILSVGSTITVQPGATLNVLTGTRLVAAEASGGTFGIAVGGDLYVANATFSRTGTTGNSALTVNAGGRLTATGPTSLGWSNVTANSGAAVDAEFVTFAANPLVTLNSGAAVRMKWNDFASLGNNRLVAVGSSTATIDLSDNAWGAGAEATSIGNKIRDQADDPARPTVQFSPFLSNLPAHFLTPASLPVARAGAAYNQPLTATGGAASNYRVTAGALPDGVTLSATGLLSGTPTEVGSFAFTVAADLQSGTVRQLYWVLVNAPAITFSPTALPWTQSNVSYSQALTAAGGTGPYSQFVVSAGTLPPGLSLAADGVISGTPTTDGDYRFTVTAQDSTTGPNAPYTGSQAFRIVVDSVAPVPGTANDGPAADIDFQAFATTVAANWTGFTDPGSGIAAYQWAVGTTPGGADVRAFTAVGTANSATASGLSLVNGTTYYVSVRAIDAVGNVSAPATSDGVTVDTLPPTPGTVSDGPGADIDLQVSQTSIEANWTGFADAVSGLASYAWAIGTTPGGTNVRPFTNVGAAAGATASGLSLSRGTRYYVSVRATDAVGNVGAAVASDGVVVVTPPPVITGFTPDTGVVGDGRTRDTTPTLSGTAEPGATVQVYDGPDLVGEVPAGGDGGWQFLSPELADGPHPFTATATDAGGQTSPPSDPLVLTVDTAAPTVTINQGSGQADPTPAGPVTFDVVFSEPVTGFTAADVSFAGSTVGGILTATITQTGPTTYTVTVSGMTGDGTVVASIPATAVADLAGNPVGASTGTDNSVAFDEIAPTVTINKAAAQPDPASQSPIRFEVTFSEPVGGFTVDDVSFAGSTVGGTLAATVTQTGPTTYTVEVTGMTTRGDLVASIPVGAVTDPAGNPNAASTGTDNAVHFLHAGVVELVTTDATTPENNLDGTPVSVTLILRRTEGSEGTVSVTVALDEGTARAADFGTPVVNATWGEGDTADRTVVIPIVADPNNEGRETFALRLTGATGGATLGAATTATVAIAPSDGKVILGAPPRGQKNSAVFPDAAGPAGDNVTVALGGRVGTAMVYLTDPDGDGFGPVEWIDLAGTDPTKSTLTLTTRKSTKGIGDGRSTLGEVSGTGLKSLTARNTDLVGAGIHLTGPNGYLGSLTVGNVAPGADIVLTGNPPASVARPGVKVTAGVVADGVDLTVANAPLASLTAVAYGDGTITAPGVGAITMRGKAKTRTTPAIPGDFKADLTVAGTGLASAKVPALRSLKVAGAIDGSTIRVGGVAGTSGDVGSVTAGAFRNSRLFAGYAGPDDGSGTFNLPATIKAFRVTGKSDGFANSTVIAGTITSAALASVRTNNGGTEYGLIAGEGIGRVTVGLPSRFVYPGDETLGDFAVRVV